MFLGLLNESLFTHCFPIAKTKWQEELTSILSMNVNSQLTVRETKVLPFGCGPRLTRQELSTQFDTELE